MADDDKKSAGQSFLTRWSQLKQQAREAPSGVAPADDVAETPAPELPPVDQLTPQSDFSAFMHPKVDPQLRRAALRKLFSDPHFNVMDGLDTYVDDYSQPDPLPPGMLAGLRQAQNILAWAKETKEETAARFAPAPDASAVSPPEQVELPAGDNVPSSELGNTTEPAPLVPKTPSEAPPAATNVAERKS